MNRYKQHVRCFTAVTERDAALSLLRERSVFASPGCLWARTALCVCCNFDLLFYFFHLHIMCIPLLHFGVLSRVT